MIRREERALRKNMSEQRKILASYFNTEKIEPALFPSQTDLDPNIELKVCETKIAHLIAYCDHDLNRRTRQSKGKVSAKSIHLEHRLQRICQNNESFVRPVNQLLAKIDRIRDYFLTNADSNSGRPQGQPPRQSTPLNEARSTNQRSNSMIVSDIDKEIEALKSRLSGLSFERDCLKQQSSGFRPYDQQPPIIAQTMSQQPPVLQIPPQPSQIPTVQTRVIQRPHQQNIP
jgi:hypothetical protein